MNAAHADYPADFEMEDEFFTDAPLVADGMGAYEIAGLNKAGAGDYIVNPTLGAAWVGAQPNPLACESELVVVSQRQRKTETWTGERTIYNTVVTTRVVAASDMSPEIEELISELRDCQY